MAFWYQFDSFIREINGTNNALGHLWLTVTGKRFKERKALFNFLDKSKIRDFDDTAIMLD